MSSFYTIRNLSGNKDLTHPAVGLWNTSDIQEAQEMLKACHEYLESLGLKSIIEDFIIWDISRNKEVSCCNSL